MPPAPLVICGHTIEPGANVSLKLPTPKLYTFTPVDIPIHVINSQEVGPRLFVCAALHGDEITGVEIIRRLMKLTSVQHLLRGTLILIPVVNIYGFIYQSRYLPDRRDLNRNFPGTRRGPLAARLAKLFLDEIVKQCTHGIDLHSGSLYRRNLPQIRVDLDQKGAQELAKAFGATVILHANLRDGSLRQAATEINIPVLVYEAGEALRFEEEAIRSGVKGIVRVMQFLGMLRTSSQKTQGRLTPFCARASRWMRAPRSGMLHRLKPLGKKVVKGEVLGILSDPFGSEEIELRASCSGIIVGHSTIPLVTEGEALFHIAY